MSPQDLYEVEHLELRDSIGEPLTDGFRARLVELLREYPDDPRVANLCDRHDVTLPRPVVTAWDLATPQQRQAAVERDERQQIRTDEIIAEARAGKISRARMGAKLLANDAAAFGATPAELWPDDEVLVASVNKEYAHEVRQHARSGQPRPVRVSRSRAACGHARPRERRDGSRRHSTRGSTSDDPGGGQSDEGESEPRRCLGCGADISHRRKDAVVCGRPGCQKAKERAKQAQVKAACDARSRESRWDRSLEIVEALERVDRALADGRLARLTADQQRAGLIAEALSQALTERRRQQLGCKPCSCGHPWPRADEDGDVLCTLCGRYLGRISHRLNGFDTVDAVMRARPEMVKPCPPRVEVAI